jgi:hypothetical protein
VKANVSTIFSWFAALALPQPDQPERQQSA